MKIAWLIQNLVAYHHARFNAFANQSDVEAHLIQVTDRDRFSVLEFEPENQNYALHTLFSGCERETIAPEQIKFELDRTLRIIQPDCICVSGWGMEIGQQMHRWALEHRLPIVLFSESTAYDEPRKNWKEWIKRRLVHSAASSMVGGTAHREYIEQLGMSKDLVFDGHNVVDSAHFSTPAKKMPEGLPGELDSTPFFVACTRFGEKKNLPRLVRAYVQYMERCAAEQQDAYKLVIAGDGRLKKEIEQEIDRTGARTHVLMLGAVGYDTLPWLYQKAQAFVHASTTEQWGLVINEAMAAGAPLLLSRRCGCAPDLLREGENGLGFDPYNEQDIADALFRFTTLEVNQKNAFGEKSEEIIKDWGPERFAKNLERAVQVAMNAPPARTNLLVRLLLGLLIRRGQIT